ncbi:hypothetical protein [Streptomyces sp. NPDC047315]|uniref:hypothetical protein n=1 Tax=Streptomyces sp. NPDC047315 TaxID=3155142 RepID=UPI0033EA67F4
MRLRKANLVITAVAAFAGAGMVAGRVWIGEADPLDLGPVVIVQNTYTDEPETPAPLPSATSRGKPSGARETSPATPSRAPSSYAPPNRQPPPTSARPPGGKPVPPIAPPRSDDNGPGIPGIPVPGGGDDGDDDDGAGGDDGDDTPDGTGGSFWSHRRLGRGGDDDEEGED